MSEFEHNDETLAEDRLLAIMGYEMGEELDPEDLVFNSQPDIVQVGQEDGSSWPDFIVKED